MPNKPRSPTPRLRKFAALDGLGNSGALNGLGNSGALDGLGNSGALDGLGNSGALDGFGNSGALDGRGAIADNDPWREAVEDVLEPEAWNDRVHKFICRPHMSTKQVNRAGVTNLTLT